MQLFGSFQLHDDPTTQGERRMYRIRRPTGGEVTLASLDELAAAIVAGTVTADAEIHHQRADRWLPIANHPHFRIASDRASSAAAPAPKAAPTPAPTAAPATAQPALRLVRSDMGSPAAATPESRPTSRWTPPRPATAAPRSSGSAVPAVEPSGQLIEFVAEAPAAEAAAPEPVRPKRVEPATAGLPMLDIEMPQPPRPVRAPTPMPAPISWPSQTKPRPESVAPRAPEPVVAAPVPAPVDVTPPAPAPVAIVAAPEPAPEPAAATPTAAPEPVKVSSMPWQASEVSLDVPPPVSDFSDTPLVTEPAGEMEPVMAAAEPSMPATKSRWPMYVGAVVVLGAMAFLALRPRADVESLAPKPSAPMASRPSPAVTGTVVDAPTESERPQITPIVPPGPSLELTAPAPDAEPAAPVVPAAPKVREMVPASAVGNLDLQLDPTAAQRQRALEETRRQIETEMQR
jgi:hypothetical protein